MKTNERNQFLQTAPWQKVLIAVVGVFALFGVMALAYTWWQGKNGEENFLLRFLKPEQEQVIYTEEEKLRILESLSAASSGIEEKPLEVSEKEEILEMMKAPEGEKPLSTEEKLDILESLRSAE